MEKSIAGLIGAVGALAAVGPAHAAPAVPESLADAMRIESYADLLRPVPNALAVRQALAEVQAETAAPADVMTVQYYHHHHHRYYRRRFYHHHHHHHHYHHRFYR